MDESERHAPPAILGDANGPHWSAYTPDSLPEETDVLDVTVAGDVIRFMWDYAVQIPLWDQEGKLPEEPEWLRQVLLISDELIEDMAAWGNYMNRLDGEPSLRTDGGRTEMNRQGRVLADRLQAELGSRYTVEYKPW